MFDISQKGHDYELNKQFSLEVKIFLNTLLEPLYQLKYHPHWQGTKPGMKV